MTDEVMKVAQESARGSFFLISGTAISTVILAVSAILIARLLGSDAYGQYSLVIVVPQLLFLFTDLGFNQGITKFTSDFQTQGDFERVASIIKHGLLVRALIGIIISVVTYVFADFLASVVLQRPELSFLVQISAISILFQVIFTTSVSAFVGMDKNEYNALTMNIQSLAKTIIQIVLILMGFAVAGAIIGHVISYLVAGAVGIVLVFFLLRKEKGVSNSFGFADNTRLLLHYGTPLYLSTMLIGVVPLFQSIVLAFFASDADIGNFKAATNFALLMTVLSVPIQTAMLPAFSKLKNGASHRIPGFFKLANKYTALIVVPVTVAIVIFSGPIVQIVYGSTYNSASQFLWTYCLVYLLVGFGYLTLASFYNGLGDTRVTLRISLVTFAVLAGLSPMLTSIYGVQGLIGAYLVANGSGQIYSSYYARKRYKVEFDTHSLLKIYTIAILSSVAPVLILNYAGLIPVEVVAVGGILYLFTYLTLMPVFKVVSTPELKQATHVVQNTPFLKKAAKII
ncbi:MAG TPA: flippase, partial [Candidatus Binatia bacterium]|nr:flippase [Candidatus Binatia bacterium]